MVRGTDFEDKSSGGSMIAVRRFCASKKTNESEGETAGVNAARRRNSNRASAGGTRRVKAKS